MMCELGKKKGENNKERTKNNEMKIIEKNNYIKGVQVIKKIKFFELKVKTDNNF